MFDYKNTEISNEIKKVFVIVVLKQKLIKVKI